ncbi:UDP-phosphate N-acetylglucosaminyl 1-phosphate transferase, partial [Candidatus Parcubacteria bacterium]
MVYLAAFIVASGLTAWLAGGLSPLQLQDVPNERSLHHFPKPRTGGLAIIAGIVCGWGALHWKGLASPWLLEISVAAVMVAVVSFLDDVFSLSPLVRFPVHLLAAAWIVAGSGLPLWELAIGVLGLVWMLNLYNFMDGMDGFAGGMSVIGFSALGLAGWLAGDGVFMSTSLCIAAASAGFLMFNFPPARIFMGDV